METEIRQIKQQLRMAMNGIVSSSMREKGVNYRVNFGLTAPLIKRIADTHDKRADLAEYLWNEQVRESKILATLLYPENEFTETVAGRWIDSLEQAEIADQLCFNLAGKRPYAIELALRYTASDTPVKRYAGFQLLTRAMHNKFYLTEAQTEKLITDILSANQPDTALFIKAAAINCLKFAMRQHPDTAQLIVQTVKNSLYTQPENEWIRSISDELNTELEFLEESIF
ncbi:MAG: DNA alkylation repair protein [Bacteroidaceae bacterium]|nr:DNA alkylation repair protein [Bacteroidaceae bacterium]